MTSTRLLSISIRLTGVAALLLGVLFWTGHALALVTLHTALGLVLVLSLWSLAVVTALRGGPRRLVILAVAWGLLLLLLGVTQTRLLPGSLHWVIRVVHLAIGGFAIRLGELLARAGSSTSRSGEGEVGSSAAGLRRAMVIVPLALVIAGVGAGAVWA